MKEKQRTITIETPEHFELNFELAGIGSRFLAFVVDRLIQGGVILGLFLVVMLLVSLAWRVAPSLDPLTRLEEYLGQWIIAVAIVVYGIVSIGYFIAFEYFWSGSTPGKKSQQIRVMRKDGRPLSFLDSAVRNILRFFDILFDIYPLGLVVMFFDSRNRRLGDLAAGTLVIVDRHVNRPIGEPISEKSNDSDPEMRQVVIAMSPHDYRLVAKFLDRRSGLDEEHRMELARRIYGRVFKRRPNPGIIGEDLEVLLERVEHLYRERMRIL